MGRMKESYQELQQIEEEAIERLVEAGYSREAAIRQTEYITHLYKKWTSPKMHKEESDGVQEDETGA